MAQIKTRFKDNNIYLTIKVVRLIFEAIGRRYNLYMHLPNL